MRSIYQLAAVAFLVSLSFGAVATGQARADRPCNPLVCSVKGP
jgi:hypothetical protein